MRQLPWRLQRRRRQHLEISADTSTPNGVALGPQLPLFERTASVHAAVLTVEREALAALAALAAPLAALAALAALGRAAKAGRATMVGAFWSPATCR